MIFALERRWCSLILVVELLVFSVYDINSQIFGGKIEIFRNEKNGILFISNEALDS